VVVEATGRYEGLLTRLIQDYQIAVAVAKPLFRLLFIAVHVFSHHLVHVHF
jgi:hypothetical protein